MNGIYIYPRLAAGLWVVRHLTLNFMNLRGPTLRILVQEVAPEASPFMPNEGKIIRTGLRFHLSRRALQLEFNGLPVAPDPLATNQ